MDYFLKILNVQHRFFFGSATAIEPDTYFSVHSYHLGYRLHFLGQICETKAKHIPAKHGHKHQYDKNTQIIQKNFYSPSGSWRFRDG